ncbi:MAG: tetratricopeptide repeat protein, partial [Bacteroidales bacterium]
LYLQGSYKLNQKEYDEAIALFEEAGDSWMFASEQATCYYKLAYCFLETGKIKEAKGLYAQLSSDKQYYMAADYYLAYISYLEKDYDKALKGFMPLINMPEYREVVPFYVAQIYFINGNYEKAIEHARKLSAVTNTNVESRAEMLRLIGESYYYMGNGSQAVTTLRQYTSLTQRPTRSAFYALGLSEYEAGDYRQAIQSLSKCTASQDIYAQTAYYYLALSYLKIQETGNARMAFEVASKMNFDQKVKEMAMYNYALTVYQTAFSPFNESVTAFEQFLNAYPNSVYADQASSYLVDVYMTTKNYLGALQSIQKIAKPGAKILGAKQRILFYLGTEQVVNADYPKAISLFTESIDLGSYNADIRAEACYWRGESYYRLENYPQAISNMQRFLNETSQRNQPIYALALYNLGYAYFKSFDFAKAKGAFERFAETSREKQSALYADALNRLGDCQYYRREFSAAERSYATASQSQGGSADYAMFQKATMQGIQRQQALKIETLNQLLANYPKSEYVDDALLERGKASILMNNYAGGIRDFKRVISDFNTSNLAPTAAIQLSLAYRNTGEEENALESYRYILKNFPGSDEAKVANADLKSMYQDLNRIDEYARYVNSLGGAFTFSATEQDSLTYLAAEQTYLKGDNIKGEQSFIKYLQSFPEGAFILDANFNLGMITLRTSKEVAERYFTKVISFPNNKYTEDALFELGTIHLG